jgi:hypothetical protein
MMLAIDDHADRLSLQEFLTGITDVEVREVPGTPVPGTAGPVWDVLSVACGAGGGVTAACYAIREWIKSRVATVKLTVGGPHDGDNGDGGSHDPVRAEIAQAVHGVSDVLLFYYVGHGQLLHGGDDMGLALADISVMPHMRGPTSFLFHDLRQMLEASRARVKILILDCCFSGIAVRGRPLDATYVWAAWRHASISSVPIIRLPETGPPISPAFWRMWAVRGYRAKPRRGRHRLHGELLASRRGADGG